MVGVECGYGDHIIETVAQADDGAGQGRRDIGLQPGQRVLYFVGRQQGSAAPRNALGFPEVQVTDDQQLLRRPVQRTRRACDHRLTGKGEDVPVLHAFR